MAWPATMSHNVEGERTFGKAFNTHTTGLPQLAGLFGFLNLFENLQNN